MLLTLSIPAGVRSIGTDVQASGRWREASLVRWVGSTPRPVGGWRMLFDDTGSTPRGAQAWRDNSEATFAIFGAHDKVVAYDEDNGARTVTPAGLTSAGDNGTSWTFDAFGEVPLGVSSHDQTIYEWDRTASAMTATTGAPECKSLLVTDERFVMALAAGGNERQVKWSDQEDRTSWTASATNQAGSLILSTRGRIMCGHAAPRQAVILTSADAHALNYSGPPFVYGSERIGSDCGVISRRASAEVGEAVYWMGKSSFFRYAGGAVEPLACEVWDEVFPKLNRSEEAKCWAVNNAQHSEVWFFYPSSGSSEPNKYVAYNYLENHWITGTLTRTCGVDGGLFDTPIWVGASYFGDTDWAAFTHEDGFDHITDVGVYAAPYIESGPVALGDGEQTMSATKFLPDEQTQGEATVTFKTRFFPNDVERDYGPYAMGAPTSVRFTGRQVRMRVDAKPRLDWRWGVGRLEVQPRGKR